MTRFLAFVLHLLHGGRLHDIELVDETHFYLLSYIIEEEINRLMYSFASFSEATIVT
jgi:hypothetical protein